MFTSYVCSQFLTLIDGSFMKLHKHAHTHTGCCMLLKTGVLHSQTYLDSAVSVLGKGAASSFFRLV